MRGKIAERVIVQMKIGQQRIYQLLTLLQWVDRRMGGVGVEIVVQHQRKRGRQGCVGVGRLPGHRVK